MNFNIFKKSKNSRTSKNEDKENIIINNKTTINESDIYFNPSNKNRHLIYDNETIIKLNNENEIQNNEISLLKSKLKKITYDYNSLREKYKTELYQLSNENKQLEISNIKIKKEKEKYINTYNVLD